MRTDVNENWDVTMRGPRRIFTPIYAISSAFFNFHGIREQKTQGAPVKTTTPNASLTWSLTGFKMWQTRHWPVAVILLCFVSIVNHSWINCAPTRMGYFSRLMYRVIGPNCSELVCVAFWKLPTNNTAITFAIEQLWDAKYCTHKYQEIVDSYRDSMVQLLSKGLSSTCRVDAISNRRYSHGKRKFYMILRTDSRTFSMSI